MKEIGSEFSLCSESDYYFNRLNCLGKSISFLRCGRDALGFVADLIVRKSNVILMPAYCCDSMIQPFQIRGWRVVFYPINADFSADLEYVTSIYRKVNPDAILLMNFFGISDTSKSVNLIKKDCKDIQIIEDITHIVFDLEKTYSENVDYYVGSIRKWLGITDGALVISSKTKMPEIQYEESDFVELRRKGLGLKEQYLHSDDSSIKTLYRQLLSDAENSLEDGIIPYRISPKSQQLLNELNCAPIINNRKNNSMVLLKYLKTIPKVNFPTNIDQVLENTTFSLPIFVDERDIIQRELAQRGIYASILWPINETARQTSTFASFVESTMLSIPVDQRYDAADMKQIYEVFKIIFT